MAVPQAQAEAQIAQLSSQLAASEKRVTLAKAQLRGKFTVTNPDVVQGLKLSVAYRGGLVLYLNGKELHREHVAKDASLAEGPAGTERKRYTWHCTRDLNKRTV